MSKKKCSKCKSLVRVPYFTGKCPSCGKTADFKELWRSR